MALLALFIYTTDINQTDVRLIPNSPTNLQISEEVDKRVGFFGHVILNISWDRPESIHIHILIDYACVYLQYFINDSSMS